MSTDMVNLFEHLRETHHGLATFIFASSMFVIVVSVIGFFYFRHQDRAKREQRREERRAKRRRGHQKR